MKHVCPKKGCQELIIRSRVACYDHWMLVSWNTRTALTAAWRNSSPDHLELLKQAISEMNAE